MSEEKDSGKPLTLPSQSRLILPASVLIGRLRLGGPAAIGVCVPDDGAVCWLEKDEDGAMVLMSVGKRRTSLILPMVHC